MSASSSPVARPLAARPSARLTAVVDLPTPPLPEAHGDDVLHARHVDAAAAAGRLARGRAMAVAMAVTAGRGRRWRRGARSEVITAVADRTPGMRAERLFAGLAQRLEGGAAGGIDVEGDRDMTRARGNAAHHAQRRDAAARRRIDDGIENLADGRFADFRHVLLLSLRRNFASAA